MNATLELLLKRKSVRAYTEAEISAEVRAQILAATLRAPTAGNMMLYSIIDVKEQRLKDRLAITCDHQPFIAKAPLVWLFLADYQRVYDYFRASGVEQRCAQKGTPMRQPQEADLFLACCDALIAAQTAVIAAESLGLGSCYIGDIMENYEEHQALFGLPTYVFPIALVCFGHPTPQQQARAQTSRFDPQFVVFEDHYRRLEAAAFEEMYREPLTPATMTDAGEGSNSGQRLYFRKFDADFSHEMNRSVRAIVQAWTKG
jgi:nitroreductase